MDSKDLYAIYQQHPVITTDSRECPEGSIFIALKGESFDGNQFAAQALDKGCAVAIVDDEQVYNNYTGDKQLILVTGHRHHRHQRQDDDQGARARRPGRAL